MLLDALLACGDSLPLLRLTLLCCPPSSWARLRQSRSSFRAELRPETLAELARAMRSDLGTRLAHHVFRNEGRARFSECSTLFCPSRFGGVPGALSFRNRCKAFVVISRRASPSPTRAGWRYFSDGAIGGGGICSLVCRLLRHRRFVDSPTTYLSIHPRFVDGSLTKP